MTALRAEGCGIALTGDAYKVSVTGLAFSIIRYDKHYGNQPPPVAFPPLVPYATKGGISLARQGGWPVFRRPSGRLYGFRRQRRYKKWRRRRRTSPVERYFIPPEGGALNPPVRRSRSQAEPLAPRAKGPAAPSTLTPVRACQPSGILESTAQVPVPVPIPPLNPQAPKGLVHNLSQRRLS